MKNRTFAAVIEMISWQKAFEFTRKITRIFRNMQILASLLRFLNSLLNNWNIGIYGRGLFKPFWWVSLAVSPLSTTKALIISAFLLSFQISSRKNIAFTASKHSYHLVNPMLSHCENVTLTSSMWHFVVVYMAHVGLRCGTCWLIKRHLHVALDASIAKRPNTYLNCWKRLCRKGMRPGNSQKRLTWELPDTYLTSQIFWLTFFNATVWGKTLESGKKFCIFA